MPSSINYPAALLIAGLIYASSVMADDLSIYEGKNPGICCSSDFVDGV